MVVQVPTVPRALALGLWGLGVCFQLATGLLVLNRKSSFGTNITELFNYCGRWAHERLLNWRHKDALRIFVEALRDGQEAVMLSWTRLPSPPIRDWPMAMEARISLKHDPAKPRVGTHPTGVGLIIELTRWDLKQQGDIAFLVTHEVEYQDWVREEMEANPTVSAGLSWAILHELQGKNEALARIVAPKVNVEFRREVDLAARRLTSEFIKLVNLVDGPDSSLGGHTSRGQEAMAFRQRFRLICRLSNVRKPETNE